MQKMNIHIATLINFHTQLLEKYGENIKVRNYYRDEPPDPYFLFERRPSGEVMEFVKAFFENEGGYAEFSDDGKKFVVYEKDKSKQ